MRSRRDWLSRQTSPERPFQSKLAGVLDAGGCGVFWWAMLR